MEVLPCSLMTILSRAIGANEVFDCRDQGLSIDRATAFAVAVADLLQLPDDMPLMPAVTAAMSIPTRLSDRASLAHLRAVAHAAGAKVAARPSKDNICACR